MKKHSIVYVEILLELVEKEDNVFNTMYKLCY